MQYKMGKIDAKIKPYRKPRLTLGNCAIDPSKQAKLYAQWAHRQGLDTVHVYPVTRVGTHCADTRTVMHQHNLKMVEVDPKEWK